MSKARRPSVSAKWIRGEVDTLAIEEGCYFDAAEAERPIRFIEGFCRHSKGQWAGQAFKLVDWQADYTRRLYGWRRPDGTRRYRTSYLEVPKKNGKSTYLSGKSIYHTVADREAAAEVYVNAYDLSQARIIFDESARMVRSSPSLAKYLQVIPSAKRIIHHASNSVLRALSADVASKDGVSASYTIFDELHRQTTPDMWDIFEYAGAARRQPLLESITTAGYDRHSICYRQHVHTKQVNAGLKPDTSHLGVIYAAEADDDIEDPAVWRKANPSLGVTISEDDFKREVKSALENPTKLNNLLRLRFNIWTNASERFIRRDRWDECGLIPVDQGELEGEACFVGGDLASTTDLAAYAMVFPSPSGIPRVILRCFAPEENATYRESRDRVPYLTWARQGYLTLTPGNVIDYAWIRQSLNDDRDRYPVAKLGLDPWNATQLATQLAEDDGFSVEFVRQGFQSLNGPTKELERLVMSRRLAHGDNPILNWAADNAVASRDPAGSVKLDKSKSTERIDPLAAVVNALAVWLGSTDSTEPSIYETRRGLEFI